MQQGYSAGYAKGLNNEGADNTCPTGVTGGDCADYQTGYGNGYPVGLQIFNQNWPVGNTAGAQRATNGATANNACPTSTTGDACKVYQRGYDEGYAEYRPYYDNGYSNGYVAGYDGTGYNDALPSGENAKYATAYQTGYQAAYQVGVHDKRNGTGPGGGSPV